MMKSNFLNIFSRILILLLFFFVVFGSFQKVSAGGYYDGFGTVSDKTSTPGTSPAGGSTEDGIYGQAKTTISESDGVSFKNNAELNERLDDLWEFIRWMLGALSVFGTISSFLILTKSFVTLAWLPDFPMERRKCYKDILTSGICTILFAGLSLVMTVFFKTFQAFITKNIFASSNYRQAIAYALIEYKYLIAGACGVLSLTLIAFLIKDIVALAASGGNPRKREESMRSILFTLIGIAGTGGVGLLVSIFNGLLVI